MDVITTFYTDKIKKGASIWEKMNIWFDEEGDFLEITSVPSKKGFFKDVGNDIWERVDTNGKVLGFAILNFKMFK